MGTDERSRPGRPRPGAPPDASPPDGVAGPLDPELEALPGPRRPWRRATLVVLALTAFAACAVARSLLPLARYGADVSAPRELGALSTVKLEGSLANAWVHTTGPLSARGVEYQRPLDPDRYRLVRSADDARLWVELRIPDDVEPERYLPPSSFVGRLVPLREAGLRHSAIRDAVQTALGQPMPDDAWLLVDGETPATTRWALALVALFLGFAAFAAWGFLRLLGTVRGSEPA